MAIKLLSTFLALGMLGSCGTMIRMAPVHSKPPEATAPIPPLPAGQLHEHLLPDAKDRIGQKEKIRKQLENLQESVRDLRQEVGDEQKAGKR